MARLAALHALDVLAEPGLHALAKFSGSDGFRLTWDVPGLHGLGGRPVWDVERAVVAAVASSSMGFEMPRNKLAAVRRALAAWIRTAI